jgi:hypothetical protein
MWGKRHSSWIARIFCAAEIILTLAEIILTAGNLSGNLIQVASNFSWVLLPIVFSAVGALIISSQPRNRIGWLLMCPAIFFAAVTPVSNYQRS